ncbi:MAG: hypothetical protein CM15mP18_0780 [Methanobacteriota archaeon]|nr:MAG: hypothetical protein CM15mP18_0780 [Euryarchaeota archaeon]
MARGLAAGTALDWPCTFPDSVALACRVVLRVPGHFLTTMVGLWVSQGPDVPLGAAGPMLLGSTSVAVYACLAMWSFLRLGLVGLGGGVGFVHRRVDPALFVVGHALGFSARSHSAGSGTPVMRSSTALMPEAPTARSEGPQGRTGNTGNAGARVERSSGTGLRPPRSICSTRSTKGAPRAGLATCASASRGAVGGHAAGRSCLWLLKFRLGLGQPKTLELPFSLVEMRLAHAQEFAASSNIFTVASRSVPPRSNSARWLPNAAGLRCNSGFHSCCSRPVHVLDRGGYRAVGEVDQRASPPPPR